MYVVMFDTEHFKIKKMAVLSALRRERGRNMSFAEKYNKGIIFDIDITDFTFMKLETAYTEYGDNVVKVDGLYINKKGKYNPHPIAINVDEGLLIDLPEHMTEVVEDILKDAESISLIKKGAVGLRAKKYKDKKYNKTCYSAEWVDL